MAFPFTLTQNLVPSPPVQAPNRQDLLDYKGSGQVQSARYINPSTKDFELNGSNGQFFGENATDQSVLFALATSFNSSSVLNLGNNYNRLTLPVIGPFINQQMTNLLYQCLGSLVPDYIAIQDVDVTQVGQNAMQISFTYLNLSSGQSPNITWTTNNGISSYGQ